MIRSLFIGGLLITLCIGTARADPVIDSLERVVRTADRDSQKIDALNLLVDHYYTRDPDTAMVLAEKALKLSREAGMPRRIANSHHRMGYPYYAKGKYEKALESWRSAMRIREKEGFEEGLITSYNNIGVIHFNKGRYDSALYSYKKSLKFANELEEKRYKVDAYTNIGNVQKERGFYQKAVDRYLKALEISEKEGMKKRTSTLTNNIGNVHKDHGNYEKARDYYQRTLRIKRRLGDRRGISNALTNIGIVHDHLGQLEKAKAHYRKSLKIDRELGNKNAVADAYLNLGTLYRSIAEREGRSEEREKASMESIDRKMDSAHSYLRKALKLQKAIEDREGIGESYRGLGSVHLQRDEPGKALTAFQKAASIADSMETRREYYLAHKGISNCYERLGDHDRALEHFKTYEKVKEAVNDRESKEQIAKMEAKYEDEKQKHRIEVLEKEKEKEALLAKEQARRQRIIIASISGGLLLLGVLVFLIHQRLRITRRQKRVIEDQKAIVDTKQRELNDSITYARKIQNALLQSEEHVSPHLPDHFILFKPYSQVSGDFYWAQEHQGYFYIAAVDCTGHGVPGAFMSMLGISQLNEIMNTDELLTPGEILTELRDRVVRELSGSDPERTAKDGMDAAVVKIPIPNAKSQLPSGEGLEVQFAGAQNPLYVIRKGIAEEQAFPKFQTLEKRSEGMTDRDNNRLKPFKKSSSGIEIKGDPMPVGYDEHAEGDFTTVSLRLQKGDMLYIFSDGYADQFGGPKGKKFRYGPFKELLAGIHERPLEEQKQELDRIFEDWKKESDQEQIDDVVIVGVRV